MRARILTHDDLVAQWAGSSTASGVDTDYALLCSFGPLYVARSRLGMPAIVTQLSSAPSGSVARRGSGFELVPYTSLQFVHGDRAWIAPAAALICREPNVLAAFSILAVDIAERLSSKPVTWADVLGIVQEWQALMARGASPTAESEVGLWGELWLLANCAIPDDLMAAWRGPERAAFDFFLDGHALEIKTSCKLRQHHVSQSQLVRPAGDHPCWLLSLWVGIDPVRGITVPALVDRLLKQISDPGSALRKLLTAGYSSSHRDEYEMKLVLFGQPEWYPADVVPRVREVDEGVSQLRYCVRLDDTKCVRAPAVSTLWSRFLGRDFDGEQ